MNVRFGSDLREGDALDGHVIVTVVRGPRGEIHVTLDNGQRRQYAWNQQVIR